LWGGGEKGLRMGPGEVVGDIMRKKGDQSASLKRG